MKGLKKAEKRLLEMARRCQDLTPVFTQASQEIRALVAQSFATQSSPDGRKWAPLDADTIRQAGRSTAGGSLAGTVQVVPSRTGLTVASLSEKAAVFQRGRKPRRTGSKTHTADTAGQRGRPFLPFTKRGGWMRRGEAGAILTRLIQRIKDYCMTKGMTFPDG